MSGHWQGTTGLRMGPLGSKFIQQWKSDGIHSNFIYLPPFLVAQNSGTSLAWNVRTLLLGFGFILWVPTVQSNHQTYRLSQTSAPQGFYHPMDFSLHWGHWLGHPVKLCTLVQSLLSICEFSYPMLAWNLPRGGNFNWRKTIEKKNVLEIW